MAEQLCTARQLSFPEELQPSDFKVSDAESVPLRHEGASKGVCLPGSGSPESPGQGGPLVLAASEFCQPGSGVCVVTVLDRSVSPLWKV